MATDTHDADVRPVRSQEGAIFAGALAIGLVTAVAALVSGIAIILAATVLAIMGMAWLALRRGYEPIVVFVAFALVLRPLVDLGAQDRSSVVAPTEVFGIASLGIALYWLIHHRAALAPRLVNPLALALLGLAAVYALASVGSTSPFQGLTAALRIATGIAMFFVVDLLLHQRRIDLRQIISILLASAVIPLLFPLTSLFGVEVFQEKDGVEALKSVFFLSNNFAYFLIPVLAISLAWTLRERGWMRYASAAIFLVGGLCLLLTATRGAWLAAAAAVIVVTWLLDKRLMFAALVLCVVSVLFVPPVADRLASLEDNPYDRRGESSLDWRFIQWERLTKELDKAPVLGNGPGEAERVTGKEPHNDYLKALLETGWIGLAVYLFLIGAILYTTGSALRRARRLFRTNGRQPHRHRLIIAALVAGLGHAAGMTLGSLGENLIDNVTFLWLSLPLFALASWVRYAPAEDLTVE